MRENGKQTRKTKGQRHLLQTKNICSQSSQSVRKTITSTATGSKGEVRAPITLNGAPLVDTRTQNPGQGCRNQCQQKARFFKNTVMDYGQSLETAAGVHVLWDMFLEADRRECWQGSGCPQSKRLMCSNGSFEFECFMT